MKKENGNDMPFKADEVNWDELSGIGIMKWTPPCSWSARARHRCWKSRE